MLSLAVKESQRSPLPTADADAPTAQHGALGKHTQVGQITGPDVPGPSAAPRGTVPPTNAAPQSDVMQGYFGDSSKKRKLSEDPDGAQDESHKRSEPLLTPVDEAQAAAVKNVLLPTTAEGGGGPSADRPIDPKDIDGASVTALARAIQKYADATLKDMKQGDKPEASLADQTTILKRAITAVQAKYGVQMAEASKRLNDDTAVKNLGSATLHHSTSRWEEADDDSKQQAASDALAWTLSNEGTVIAILKKLRTKHVGSSEATIRSAYQDALLVAPAAKVARDRLAEVRLRWGPITYGKDIYLEATDQAIAVDDQWPLFKTLVHEVLHSAEHPTFADYLATAIPPGLHSDLREGITEYFARQVWADIAPGTVPKPTAHPVSAVPTEQLQTTKKMKNQLNREKHYADQVEIITNVINLDEFNGTGAKRLEQAYFRGNMKALFPDLNRDPAASSDVVMS